MSSDRADGYDEAPSSLFGRVLKRGQRLAQRVKDRAAGGRYKAGDSVPVTLGQTQGQALVGATVLQAAQALGVDLDHFCGGFCSCGTCRILVEPAQRSGLSKVGLNEETTLGPKAVLRGDRLACQARIVGPVSVRIPESFTGR